MLLGCVAVSHFALAYSADLSGWKGAGFGMFSTVDGGKARHFHVHLFAVSGETQMKIPKQFAELEACTKELPTGKAMARFANELLAVAPEHTLAIRVDLWRDHYDSETMEPSSELLRSVEIKADEH
jgi:hypothetical protein